MADSTALADPRAQRLLELHRILTSGSSCCSGTSRRSQLRRMLNRLPRYQEAHLSWHAWGDQAQEPTAPDALVAHGRSWPIQSHGGLRSRQVRSGMAPAAAASRDCADASPTRTTPGASKEAPRAPCMPRPKRGTGSRPLRSPIETDGSCGTVIPARSPGSGSRQSRWNIRSVRRRWVIASPLGNR